MPHSTGTLCYSENPHKLIVEVDPGLCDFYRSLVPKSIGLKKPMYAGHISVIRNEKVHNLQFWKKYQESLIEFSYDTFIFNDELYYWLNVYSKELEEIRSELGLSKTSEITRSPDGQHKFHITLGNLKNKRS